MSQVETLRAAVKQRLTAAAEEIFGLFERTITEYEMELSRSKQENQRQRNLLDAVFNPRVRLHRADVQQLLVIKEVSSEQQDWSPSLDQEDPQEPPHVKEEQKEPWTSQEGEQVQGPEEADNLKFTFTSDPVKTEEDDDEKPQISQLQQNQTESKLPGSSSTEQMKTEADEEDFGGKEPTRNSNLDRSLEPDADDKASDSLKNTDLPLNDMGYNTDAKPFRCSQCGKRFRQRGHLQTHIRIHTGEKPFSCSDCGKSFLRKEHLVRHMRFHSGEKPFSCLYCMKHFTRREHAVTHMRIHTGEKPFSCSVCGKSFTHKLSLKHHMLLHTKERPFRCSVCDKRFTRQACVKNHKCVCDNSSRKAAG